MFLRPVGFETTIRGVPVWEYQQTNARLAGVDVHPLENERAMAT
jgi:iron complex outermembrane receptor protein